MAAFDTLRAPAASSGFARRFGTAFTTVFGAFAAWNDARATRKALDGLSDHELEDIGLCRGDIDGVAQNGLRHF